MTVLVCSLLESRGVNTGFITVPGHIFPAFDTGISAADYRSVHPNQAMTLSQGGTLWLPLEITMLDGKNDFLSAWKSDSQAVYPPVTVEDMDLGLQYGVPDGIQSRFRSDLGQIVQQVLEGARSAANAISGFTASPGNRTITLAWNPVPGASSYTICYTNNGTDPDAVNSLTPSVIPASADGTKPSFTLDNANAPLVESGRLYSFRVVASLPNPAAPDSPRTIVSGIQRAIPLSEYTLAPQVRQELDQVSLYWPAIKGGTEFEVWRGNAPDSLLKLAKVSGNSYVDKTVSPGTFVAYAIIPANHATQKSLAIQGTALSLPVTQTPTGPILLNDLKVTNTAFRGIPLAAGSMYLRPPHGINIQIHGTIPNATADSP